MIAAGLTLLQALFVFALLLVFGGVYFFWAPDNGSDFAALAALLGASVGGMYGANAWFAWGWDRHIKSKYTSPTIRTAERVIIAQRAEIARLDASVQRYEALRAAQMNALCASSGVLTVDRAAVDALKEMIAWRGLPPHNTDVDREARAAFDADPDVLAWSSREKK